MDTKRICPGCQKPLPPDVPLGLCPECLIKAGFNTGAEPGGESTGFVPPTVGQIAKLFPQLEIIGFIGKGGMGAVYKARQPALDRFVALKILPPSVASAPGFAERFNREARALARLVHPNIVAVHDFGQAGGLHYLVMEFVDGANLREVERAGRLAPEQALAIVPQICEALQFAHNEGIVHRDIKPENLLLDKRGRVKITDFGIAKILGVPAGKASLTGAKDVVGTPHYMAPEQIEKPQTVDHRADIYSLGVVFYEMLTGELPLGKFQPPSKKVQVDVRLDEVVLHALEKEPEQRYQQASQVKTDVETIATTPANQTVMQKKEKNMSTSNCKPLWYGLAIGAVCLFIGLPAFWFLSRTGGNATQLTQAGWQLWQAQRWAEAETKFKQAVELAPNVANAWNGLGWATFNSGKAQEAEQAFQKAVSLDTNQPGALNGLGQIYLSQRKYDQAEMYLLKAAPQAPAAWYGLARLYLLEGKFDQAEKWAQNIVDSGQADETAKKMLEAAKAKKLNQGLRLLLEPTTANQSGQTPTPRANTNNAADFTSLLNDDQRAVLNWTDRQFRSFFDARTFDGWSDEERANLERRLIDTLNGPVTREYYQAINTLAVLRFTNALPKLREIAFDRRDKDNRDRWMSIRAIGIIGDKTAVPELIPLVYHGNVNTRWWAQISLVQLTGQNFGKDWNAWGKWWNESGGQPPVNPEVIRWWNGQAEPDKLAESLNESDSKWLDGFRPQTGEQYLQQQLKLAQADNYWAKFNLWEAFSQGKHEVAKNPAEADKWLSELVKGTYLAKFEPVNGFNPKTPKEMLDQFNEHCQLRSGRDSLGGASFFRTTKRGNKLIGSFLTASPDEFKTAIEKNPNLKLISMEQVTPEMFLAHEAARQESL